MPAIDQAVISGFVQEGEDSEDTTGQGRALESLVCYVFGLLPGISVTHRNETNVYLTEEIDVGLWNDGELAGVPFLPNVILVECKNWSNNVSSQEVSWFLTKLKNRGLDFGILVTKSGVTGDQDELTRAHYEIAMALPERRRLIVVTIAEIRALASTDDLVALIKRKITRLTVAIRLN